MSSSKLKTLLSLLFLIVLTGGIMLLNGSCNGCDSNPSDPNIKPGSDTVVVPPATLSQSVTEVWLDGSGSMKGYVNTQKSGQFKGIVSALCMNVRSKSCSGVGLYGLKLQPVEKYANFKERLEIKANDSPKSIRWEQESNLAKMIEDAVACASKKPGKQPAPDKLVFLITDGIMSGNYQQIKSDAAYNKTERVAMSNEIRGILSRAKGVAINVAQYHVPFNGIYYRYDNEKFELNEVNRPLYVIAIGNAHLVKEYVDKYVAPQNGITGSKATLFAENNVTFGDVRMPYQLSMNSSELEKVKDRRFRFKRGQDIEHVKLHISLHKLPVFMRTKVYLSQNGHLQYKRNKGEYRNLDSKSCPMEVVDNNQTLVYTLSKATASNTSFRFVLDYALPNWIAISSTDDDKANYSPSTTFNFSYFMDGLTGLNPDGYVNDFKLTEIIIQ